jgi:hypothetical protein
LAKYPMISEIRTIYGILKNGKLMRVASEKTRKANKYRFPE